MEITIGKLLGLVIAMSYAVAMVVYRGGASGLDLLKGFAMLLLPLALIWFPDEIGGFTGYVGRGGYVNTETPPVLVSIMGWFFLVGMPVIVYLLS